MFGGLSVCSESVEMGERATVRPYIPHARFARLSLARLSLINLFEHTIVRNAATHPTGRQGSQYRLHRESYIAIGRSNHGLSMNWFSEFRVAYFIHALALFYVK